MVECLSSKVPPYLDLSDPVQPPVYLAPKTFICTTMSKGTEYTPHIIYVPSPNHIEC